MRPKPLGTPHNLISFTFMCIVKFKLQNFKSYRNEAEFSFEALESDFKPENVFPVKLNCGREIRLLKTAVIYGANASGKSNLIWGLKALCHYVTASRNFSLDEEILSEPFALDGQSQQDDVCMTLDFIVSGDYYEYHVEYNSKRFSIETLTLIEEKRKLVFSNEVGKISFGEGWRSDSLDMSGLNILPNHLLLSELSLKPANQLQDIYRVFSSMVTEPIRETVNLKAKVDKVTTQFLKGDKSVLSNKLKEIIKSADFGIAGVTIIEHGEDDFKFPDSIPKSIRDQIIDNNRWEYQFLHRGRDGKEVSFQINDESTGTQHAFSIGALILNVLSTGGMIAYDEMGMALHPQLFKLFIQLFYDEKMNNKNAQLLFTSHDTSIVADDLMRADQIWFTQKNEYGESELYSAQDFEDMRIHVPFEEFYRRGRFGALPRTSKLASEM